MWQTLLKQVLGQGPQVQAIPVPDLPGDKPDYTPVILAAVAVAAIIAVFYFIAKK